MSLSEVLVFNLPTVGVYCPISQLNDVMFHLRLSVMLKSVVYAGGWGKDRQKVANQVFCKAFVCWV